MEPVISFEKVDHYYGAGHLRRQVLYEVSDVVQPGEIVILTGPSGSGKTTLLTLAGALRSVEHGSVRVLGRELNGASTETLFRIRESIGFIFQAHNLLDALTARQNVQMSLGLDSTVSPEEGKRKATFMLHAVGLGDKVDYLPSQLSGGQRQRVAVARALVRRPTIVLADEPTASLDKAAGRHVVDLLHQLAKMQGCAILLVTHDNRILDVADRILYLEDGRLASVSQQEDSRRGNLLATLAQVRTAGGVVAHMGELSSRQFVESMEQISSELQQFLQVEDLARGGTAKELIEQIFASVTLKLTDVMQAERGTVFLIDRQSQLLRPVMAFGDVEFPPEIPLSSGVVGRAAVLNEIVNVDDAYSHPDFDSSVDKKTGFHTRNLLCVPLHNRQREVMGVAELLNKQGGGVFNEQDEQMFRALAEPMSVIVEGLLRLKATSKDNHDASPS